MDYYAHNFLISLKNLEGSAYGPLVVYVYHHNQDGASGVIINRLGSNLGELLSELDIELNPPAKNISSHPVLSGGPINPNSGFVIYPKKTNLEDNINIDNNISRENIDPLEVSHARDTLVDIACGQGPEKFIVFLGYRNWEAGQLEQEMHDNRWLLLSYDEKLLFDTHTTQKYEQAIKLLNFDINKLSSQVERE